MTRASARARSAALALTFGLALTGCSAGSVVPGAKAQEPTTPPTPTVSAAVVTSNVRDAAKSVDVSRHVVLNVTQGQLQTVTLKGPGGNVPGVLSADQTHWRASSTLRPASDYTVTGQAIDAKGLRKRYTNTFRTRTLSLDEQTYPSFVPTENATVGIAMPVIIRFDVPVTDKKNIQKHLQVSSVPAQRGSFHWISDNEVHWRPASYWQAGTKVTVNANIGGVPAGNGIYGQKDRVLHFNIGRSQVLKVNAQTDQMQVIRGGKLDRTIPITTGKPGFVTRSGTKVIIEKFPVKRMNSETIGIAANSPDAYDINDVRWAMRVTYSGEFLHAAPWSVASQGHANVSHGCTGMSTANAGWLYANSLIGDPVEYTGTDRGMTLTNGYGDWNESFSEYSAGSAL